MNAAPALQAAHKRTNHTWTEEERELVRVRFDGRRETTERLALQLGVTFPAVLSQANRLGVMGRMGKHRCWTAKEIVWLEEHVDHLSIRQMARRLKRSINAVSVKLGRLHISTRNRSEWYTADEVRLLLGVSRLTVMGWIARGELAAKRHHEETDYREGNPWHIEEKNLKAFIREHSMELTGRNVDLSAIVAMFDAPRKLKGLRD